MMKRQTQGELCYAGLPKGRRRNNAHGGGGDFRACGEVLSPRWTYRHFRLPGGITQRVSPDTLRTKNQWDRTGTVPALMPGVNGGNQMRDTRWQLKYFQAVAALLVAAGEAWSQDNKPAARRIVVSIPDRKLALLEEGRAVKIYPVAVGATATPSPTGSFTVIVRVSQPTWYGPGRIVRPGKTNPLGPRWIGLSRKGYGIHGTSNPRSIGRPASHGCIRMLNSDVEELFGLVAVGDAVELYGERTAELAHIFNEPELPRQAVASSGVPPVEIAGGQ